MSSFWNRMTGGEKQPDAVAFENPDGQSPVAAPAAVPVSAKKPAWGIAQANELMSTVGGSDEDADLVLRVIKNTLESVGVQVNELIGQARTREGELQTQIERRESTIAELERQIEAERNAIMGLEGELALTRHTRESLERSVTGVGAAPVRPAAVPSARPAPRAPAPSAGNHLRENDRPTVVAVPPGIGEAVLVDGDIESLPPDEPVEKPRKR